MTDDESLWMRTGQARCSSCDALVRTTTLVTLPPHGCTERQRAQRARDNEQH